MKVLKALTLKTLNKSNVWDTQENDIFRMWEAAEKDIDLKDNVRHYTDIIRSAYDMEEVKIDKPEVVNKLESRGFKTGVIRIDENTKVKVGLKKTPIMRVTDLSYENIRHISASQLIEVLERNFGGGWESLSQSIQDIIESGFDISTTTLPANRLHKPGGMYEKKVNDGFEVLEISKGLWVEAIFAKEKPEMTRSRVKFETEEELDRQGLENVFEEDDEEELPEVDNLYNDADDEEDSFDEDKLTEESYRTTFDENADELNLEAEGVSDDDDY